ncbi:AF10-like protein [Mya arenaria]|uniref:AF10-like protein n=1 Tax=Mya arenaria TaxID=6604 RepID=A0ABY7DHI6_MYAAR|nr:AF10-like protein [Mya arenaria]
MKEMVGGCCVCSDERGWNENPLVYCDGNGCNVAVHQACYGIIHVPTGPWFCRKCESQERAARVRCELCPLKDGALKRTDSGGWCHVVCALFIPEAWFANVQTMEPIMLKNVPPDRAQAHGLLCEESGAYGNNVKYCGYCCHHYKKLKKDANIKTIPAFKPIPSDHATPDSTPEKSSNEPKVNFSAEQKNRESLAARQLSGQIAAGEGRLRDVGGGARIPGGGGKTTGEGKGPESAGSVGRRATSAAERKSMGSSNNNTKSEPESKKMETETSTISTTTSSVTVTTVSSGITTVPVSMATSDTKATNDVKTAPQETGKLFSPLLDGQPTPPVTTQANTLTTDTDPAQTRGLRKTRTGSLDKDRRVVRRGKAGRQRPAGRKTSLSEDGEDISPTVNKRSRKKSESVPAAAALGGETGLLASNLLPKIEASSMYVQPAMVSLPATNGTSVGEKLTNGPLIGPANPFSMQTSPDSSKHSLCIVFISALLLYDDILYDMCINHYSETPGSMEELLERQWETGSHFLMEQGQHFDIASLLSCLHKLKSENKRLEDYIHNLISRRDHLLAVNSRLTLPFTANSQSNTGIDPSESQSTPRRQEFSSISGDDDDSPINDTPGSSGCRTSPAPSNELLRHQLFSSAARSQTTFTSPIISTNKYKKEFVQAEMGKYMNCRSIQVGLEKSNTKNIPNGLTLNP